ncbi:hypothetical protein [Mesorhizobium amorphae]|uniref:hypothetical protein n=1 Tax=Mesorhizobium amorphae TaxID=71433 RepID=UPI0011832B2C|nr:hypothetical protein [Mesorhizobium amorphae]
MLVIAIWSFGIPTIVYAFMRRSLIEKYNGFGVWAAPLGKWDAVDWKTKRNEIPISFIRELKLLNIRFAIVFLVIASGFASYVTLDWLIE